MYITNPIVDHPPKVMVTGDQSAAVVVVCRARLVAIRRQAILS
ncbi:hypothetical protein [Luteimonas salinilitoris]|uniref:Uncharacterized protein n=1 Tax=Luteimonas salinilitoris TaxID=3237697 RepID=A0ABV4HRH9_9GAMM